MWTLNGNGLSYLTLAEQARVTSSTNINLKFPSAHHGMVSSDGEAHLMAGDRIVGQWQTGIPTDTGVPTDTYQSTQPPPGTTIAAPFLAQGYIPGTPPFRMPAPPPPFDMPEPPPPPPPQPVLAIPAGDGLSLTAGDLAAIGNIVSDAVRRAMGDDSNGHCE